MATMWLTRMRLLQCVRSAGFTLIELLVVLVIAAVAVAVVGVSAQVYMDRARYHQTVLDLATQLSRARGISMQQGHPVVFSWEPQTRKAAIDGVPVLDISPSLQVQWKAVNAPVNNAVAGGATVFVFDSDGRARGGSLELARGTQAVRFEINWLLGTVRQVSVVAS